MPRAVGYPLSVFLDIAFFLARRCPLIDLECSLGFEAVGHVDPEFILKGDVAFVLPGIRSGSRLEGRPIRCLVHLVASD